MSDTEITKKLFQVEEDTPQAGSLSDYIRKHLNRSAENTQSEEPLPSKTSPKPVFSPEAAYFKNNPYSKENSGMVLHHLDSQLASNHLERYLPSVSSRYHLMRERLSTELKSLRQELGHYRQFDGPEYQNKKESIEERITLIETKIQVLDQKLKEMNPFHAVYKTFQGVVPAEVNPWKMIPNNKRQPDSLETVKEELQSLQHILEEHLHDPGFSPQQLSSLVNQYDQNLKKAERMMAKMRQKRPILGRLEGLMSKWKTSQ